MDGNEGPPQYVYARVAGEIERDIRRGEWKFGARLPGRERLAQRYGVAELTIRRALRELQERGVVRVLPSSGVYVTWQGDPGCCGQSGQGPHPGTSP